MPLACRSLPVRTIRAREGLSDQALPTFRAERNVSEALPWSGNALILTTPSSTEASRYTIYLGSIAMAAQSGLQHLKWAVRSHMRNPQSCAYGQMNLKPIPGLVGSVFSDSGLQGTGSTKLPATLS